MECHLCPVGCGADRTLRAGRCGVMGLTVAKFYLHPFEEPCLSPNGKSGAVFFGGCNLRCVFCQNYEVSRAERGKKITPKELAELFREAENAGAENIDLVTPDHVSPLIAEALSLYKPRVPVVYNSGGYCLPAALEEIAPYIDVYLPDFKFASPEISARYTGRADYADVAREALAFMAKKPIVWSGDGKLLSGIVARHLVLPMCTGDSLRVLDILKEILPAGAPLSLMRQYTPMGDIQGFPELNRRVTSREYRRVKEYALSLGFSPLYAQEKESAEKKFIPKWDF